MVNELRLYTDDELMIRNQGLIKVKKGLESLNINFFLMMGVLLGAVRDKNFIKWDWDVELGLFTESIVDKVSELKQVFENENLRFEIVDPTRDGFKINLFYLQNKYTLWGLCQKGKWLKRNSYKFPMKHFQTFDDIEFLGEIYKTPNNVEKLLTYIYGDWQTPHKTNIKEDYLNSRIFNKRPLIERIINKIKLK